MWLIRLTSSNVPCGPINTIPEVFADEQVKHRGMLRELSHPTAGKVPQVGCPLRFGGEQSTSDRAPPELGADTEAVLASIGVSPEQLKALRASGIV